MKSPDQVTIYDLECTAKDAKDGVAEYKGIKVYWDDATKEFIHYIDGDYSKKDVVISILAIRNYSRH